MAMQLSDDFSETREDFERMGIAQPDGFDDDYGAWTHGRSIERDGEVVYHHEAEELAQRAIRNGKAEQRKKLFRSAVATAEWEASHLDTMAINRVVNNNGRFRRLSEAAAARLTGERRMVNGLAMDEEAKQQEAAVEKSDRSRSGGSDPGNTDPVFRHLKEWGGKVSQHKGGLDWLDLTAYGEAGDTYYAHVERLLKVREDIRKDAKQQDGIAYIGKHAGALWRQGLGSGFGHCPLVWKSGLITFRFGADRRKNDGTVSALPLMFIDIPGTALLLRGEIDCLHFVAQVLESLGIDATRIRVRRVDVCLDMVGAYRDRWEEVIARRSWVTKGSAIQPHYTSSGKFTGFNVKGGTCSLTVYDKCEEIRVKKPEIMHAMMQHRWNETLPPEAWRVEFRIKPGKSQSLEFRSLADVLDGLQSICGWACCQWFRLVKRRQAFHTERSEIDELWQEVIAGFWTWAEGGKPIGPRVVKSFDPLRVLKVGMGCLVKGLGMCGIEPTQAGLDDALRDAFAIYLKGQGGVGLEGTTEAERKEHYSFLLAELNEKFYRIWVTIHARG